MPPSPIYSFITVRFASSKEECLMEVKLVFDFIKANSFIAVTLAFFGLGAMVAVKERIGFYFWYLVVMLLGFAAAFLTNNQLYFYCFMLGMLTAFAEIIG